MQWVRNGFASSDGEVTRCSTPANSSTTCHLFQVCLQLTTHIRKSKGEELCYFQNLLTYLKIRQESKEIILSELFGTDSFLLALKWQGKAIIFK